MSEVVSYDQPFHHTDVPSSRFDRINQEALACMNNHYKSHFCRFPVVYSVVEIDIHVSRTNVLCMLSCIWMLTVELTNINCGALIFHAIG